MNFINLPKFLKSNGGKQANTTIIGTLVDEIEPHKIFKGMYCPPEARFVVIDAIGVRFNDIDLEYFLKGRVIALVHETTLRFSKKKQSGRAAFAIKGVCSLGRGYDDLVYIVGITKRNNKWGLYPLRSDYLSAETYPQFYDIILKAFRNNWVTDYGVDVPSGYIECCESQELIVKEYDINEPMYSSTSGTTVNKPREVPKPVINPVDSALKAIEEAEAIRNGVAPKKEEEPVEAVPVKVETEVKPVKVPVLVPIDTTIIKDLGSDDALTDAEKFAELEANKKLVDTDKILTNKKILKENRMNFLKKEKISKTIGKEIDKASNKVMKLIKKIDEYNSTGEDEEKESENLKETAFEYTFSQIRNNWDRRSTKGGNTGRYILKDALEKVLPDFKVKGAGGTSMIEDNLAVGKDVVINTIVNGYDGDDNKFLEALAHNSMCIYLKVIESALGIRGRLIDCYKCGEVSDSAFINMLQTNPYHLCLIDSRFKIEDLDKLAMVYGIDLKSKEVLKFRNVAYLHNYMLDNTNMNVRDNTAIKYATLKNYVKVGYILPKINYDYLVQTGIIIPKERVEDLRLYINQETKEGNFKLPQTGWRKAGLGFILATGGDSITAVNDYIDSGLGICTKVNDIEWVTDFTFIKKEMYIYNKAYELGEKNTSEVSDEDIAQCIKEFEELQSKKLGIPDYKLERRQADSLYLIKHGMMAVTGPAGSGKTTTAEAIIYAVEKLLKVPEEEIMFVAPTGKAANRLREVVKRPTRTIHSLFGVGGASYSIKDPVDKRKNKKPISVLVIDESSMINIDLMYEVFFKLDEDTRVIFLGDVEQLPPIGFGKPFANLLNFIPCAVLNVSKRASDKSGITRNAKALIYNSDDNICADLVNTPDFKLVHKTDQDDVVNVIKDLCRHHLGQVKTNAYPLVENLENLSPDDIQVISPVNKNNWGTKNLNQELQDIFNPRDGFSDTVVHKRGKDEQIEFRLNDRVIHTMNSAKRTRFYPTGKGKFSVLESKGVMNGDVGKVCGIYQSTELEINYNTEDDEAGEDELFVSENIWYLAVKYHDVDTETGDDLDFVIMYQFELFTRMHTQIQSISMDLGYLDLAYALTVHKLQGSQAKLVIGALLPVRMKSFISRNMIYTLVTRSQQGCYLVGDVKGSESVISNGRKIEQTGERVTMLDNIIK